MSDEPLYVTRPFLPPLAEFNVYLEQIWQSKWLTNRGPLHEELERALAEHLGVEHISLFTNGTIALITALQALGISGEVITTPFSFVATAHSLVWNNIRPCFVDIDPRTCNIDASLIEAAITPETTAILPVHCYGGACDVKRIQDVADTFGLKVIYDAAHAFGVSDADGSILKHGDLSVLSFHATKAFHTFEGGAIVSPNAKMKRRIDFLKNFGFADEVTIVAPGINGKMNEIQAAMGLLQLKYVDQAIGERRAVDELYRKELTGVRGLQMLALPADSTPNFSYFPVLIDEAFPLSRDGLYESLRQDNVFSRRYFYPLISDMPMYRGLDSASPARLPHARRIAEAILCLPIYPGLTPADVMRVVELIKQA